MLVTLLVVNMASYFALSKADIRLNCMAYSILRVAEARNTALIFSREVNFTRWFPLLSSAMVFVL